MGASTLLDRRALSAAFRQALTPYGHRWLLLDEGGEVVGSAQRIYKGLGRILYRPVVLFGMTAGDAIRAAVLDHDGSRVAELRSRRDSPKHGRPHSVELWDGTGGAIGVARRDEERFSFEGADGSPAGTLEIPQGGPWLLRDRHGAEIGTLKSGTVDLKSDEQRLVEKMESWDLTGQVTRESAWGRHLGFAESRSYSVELAVEVSPSDPLRPFAALSPVIAAYSY